MAQVKVYGLKSRLETHRQALSDAVQEALGEAFGLPPEKRFQRFIGLGKDEFVFPPDRSENYTILEFSVFEGRSLEAKKKLIRSLFALIPAKVGIAPQDLEITIFETPQANWGVRGLPGDELVLGYKVEV